METKRKFQIRSKDDARYLAEEIRYFGKSFHYYVPLMGVNGGMMTVRCERDQDTCTVFASTSGSQQTEEVTMRDFIEHLWKDRKLINAELRHVDSH
ncbi:MAG: hypothetical protein JXR85_00610 [Deltaproteobacteria bacterium]|jgi:hypothetical protein|nr:hypothetical protein [Deltaproteobacteria bacterium]